MLNKLTSFSINTPENCTVNYLAHSSVAYHYLKMMELNHFLLLIFLTINVPQSAVIRNGMCNV